MDAELFALLPGAPRRVDQRRGTPFRAIFLGVVVVAVLVVNAFFPIPFLFPSTPFLDSSVYQTRSQRNPIAFDFLCVDTPTQGDDVMGRAICSGGHAKSKPSWYPRGIHCTYPEINVENDTLWDCTAFGYVHLFFQVEKIRVHCQKDVPRGSWTSRVGELCWVEFHLQFNAEFFVLLLMLGSMAFAVLCSILLWAVDQNGERLDRFLSATQGDDLVLFTGTAQDREKDYLLFESEDEGENGNGKKN